MGRAHGSTRGIGEQHRHTVGRQHAEGDPGCRRHQRIGARISAGGQRLVEGDHLGAVNLCERIQSMRGGGGKSQQAHHFRAVFFHAGRIVAGARSAVQRRVNAPRDTAIAGEESVPNPALAGKDVAYQAFHPPHDGTRRLTPPAWRRDTIPGMIGAPVHGQHALRPPSGDSTCRMRLRDTSSSTRRKSVRI